MIRVATFIKKYRQDSIALGVLLGLMLLLFAKILFTDMVIRAPDIIHEYYWNVLNWYKTPVWELLNPTLDASWWIESNSGFTLMGGEVGGNINFWNLLINHFIPPPASVAWFIVIHFFIGSCGVYSYCRAIGASAQAALLGALVFALAPEMVSLINAGHVMKIATISFAPWAFVLLEKGFQRRRLIYFLATSVVLAIQFFNSHWQVAYYTCLSVGCYGLIRVIMVLLENSEGRGMSAYKLIGMNLVTLVFFLSTVAISLMPLSQWSTDTNRGVQSGENAGKGGLNRDEAMSWSLPPEELGAFVIPGLFGLSRQEAGPNPENIRSFYWGRMVFTQTTSYIGLLPWLLLPLSLIFRRDRYTLLALIAIVGGILFSMGKYTFFYNFLFDYFPGINRFRVPKMMMFIPVIGLGVIAARGVDILREEQLRATRVFRLYVGGIIAVPLLLLVFSASLKLGANIWLSLMSEMIQQPTRYEQGAALIAQRWENMNAEVAIAVLYASLYGAFIAVLWRNKISATLAAMLLMVVFVADVGRINAKFMFLTDVPPNSKGIATPTVTFLAQQSKQYRVLPMGIDPAYLGSHKIPVMFTSMPVQQVRWQEVIDTFALLSVVPDMLNVRYLVMVPEEYNKEKTQLGERYKPVFTSPDGREIVLENMNVLPKAWIVPSVFQVTNRAHGLQLLQNPTFNPRQVALVETVPPITMEQNEKAASGSAVVERYEGKRIDIVATALANSLLVVGEKYYQGWKAFVDGKQVDIYPVNTILRGVYLTPGTHKVEFRFDPLPFKIGKYLTMASFALFLGMLVREWRMRRRVKSEE
ncbi:MAG: YfhO family protein [Desulfuromonadaceae bacterium]